MAVGVKYDIEGREDVSLLIRTFYAQVREDDFIGPIFNRVIEDWDAHFDLLTDFWEMNLFFAKGYKGNPLQVHVEVDRSTEGGITQEHFGRWLLIWVNTIDSLFVGERAENAKNRARNISTRMFMRIFEARKMH